jgi:hypothetical protein
MNMIDPAALEMVGKVKGVARALFCLHARAIFLVVLLNQVARPFAVCFSIVF